MAHQSVQWGTSTLILDNEAFRQGFFDARHSYAQDTCGEDGRAPQEPQRAVALHAEDMLRLVVMPDEQGIYHFDEMGAENLPEYLGYLIGYLSAPLVPTITEHDQNQQDYLHSAVLL